MFSIIILY